MTDSLWQSATGTRTQVAFTANSGMPRILRVSRTIFSSSDVYPSPSPPCSMKDPICGIRLNPIGRWNTVWAKDDPSSAAFVDSSSSVVPASPAPLTA